MNCVSKPVLLVASLVLLSSCGGGGGSSASGTTASSSSSSSSGSGGASSVGSGITVAQGQFIDSPVGGLNYSSGGQVGLTDANGTFNYEVGQPITFSIGTIVIGTATGKAAITPVDLVAGAEDQTNPIVSNIAAFLQTLNAGGASSNSITITDKTRAAAVGNSVNFD